MSGTSRRFLWIADQERSGDLRRTRRDEHRSVHIFVQSRSREKLHGAPRCDRAIRATHDAIAFSVRDASQCSIGHEEDVATTSRVETFLNSIPKQNFKPGSSFDPFMATVVPLTSPVHALMTYSRECILVGFGSYKTEIFAAQLQPFTSLHRAAAHHAMSSALQQKHVLFPMLAASAQRTRCRRQYPFNTLFDPEKYLQCALIVIREAVTTLGRFQDDVHARNEHAESVAIGIIFLVFATGMTGRLTESQKHISGLLQVLPYLKAESLMYHWLEDLAANFDLLHSAETRKAPIVSIAIRYSRSMPVQRQQELKNLASELRSDEEYRLLSRATVESKELHELSDNIFMKFDLFLYPKEDLTLDLGSMLPHPSVLSLLSPRLQAMLSEVLECLDVARVLWYCPNSVNADDSSWLCQKARALLSRLLNLLAGDDANQTYPADHYNTCFLITLTIVLEGACHRALHLTRISHTTHLYNTLLLLFADSRDGEYSMQIIRATGEDKDYLHSSILWMLITGFWASQWWDPIYYSLANWFKQEATTVAEYLGLKSHDEIHQVLSKYLYSKTVQYTCVAEIASQIGNGHSHNFGIIALRLKQTAN